MGTVEDSTGAVIPGAIVRLDNSQSEVSGGEGRFRFGCVPVGPHHLVVSAHGFAPYHQELSSGISRDVHVTLVPADSQIINVEASDTSVLVGLNGATLSGDQLSALADDPDDLQRELQQLAATGGGPPSGTVISVDGFQSESPLPPKSSISRVEINSDLFSAENRQPPSEGGTIKIFTKPGAKSYHGSLFTTGSYESMNARDPFSDTPTAAGKQRYGFTLTGPVRKSGSNFSLALEHRGIDEVAVVNAISLDSYGSAVSLKANVPIPQRLWVGSGRIDAQLNSKNIAFGSYSVNLNHLVNAGVGGTSLSATGYDQEAYDHVLRFSDTTIFGPRLIHETHVSIDFRGESDFPNSTAPQVEVAGAFSDGGATIGPQRIRQVRTEWDDDCIYLRDTYSVKAGVQFFDYVERQSLTTNFNGTYIFGGGAAPVLDSNNNPTSGTETITGLEQYRRTLKGLAGGIPTQYSSVSGNPQVNFTEVYPAFFIQSDIRVRPNLTVSTGLRYFFANLPFQNDGFTPRLGLSWAPDKKKSINLSGHIGLFSGHSPNGLAFTEAELLREDGTNRTTSLIYNPTYGNPSAADGSVIHAVRSVASRYNSDETLTTQVGLGISLPFGFSGSTNVTYLRAWHQERTLNVNTPLDGSAMGMRPGPANLDVLELQSSADQAGDTEYAGIGNQKLKMFQFFFGAVRNHILSDTDGDAFSSPQNSRSNSGEYSRMTGNSLWETFSNVDLHMPGGVNGAINYYGDGNSPFNITTGFDNNGDGDFNDRPRFALPGSPGVLETPFGNLVATGGYGILSRNRASLPWKFHVDANIQRAFILNPHVSPGDQRTLTVNIRSSNLLNHTNVTAEGGILGSPLFLKPFQADPSRRVEIGLRYSF